MLGDTNFRVDLDYLQVNSMMHNYITLKEAGKLEEANKLLDGIKSYD